MKQVVAAATGVAAVLALVAAWEEFGVSRWLALRNPEKIASLSAQSWVQSESGSMPLLILVPHNGLETPFGLPDRKCENCIASGGDTETGDMATHIADAIERRIGRRPFVVRNLLQRRKFDANRDRDEAIAGITEMAPIWEGWHAHIDSAKQSALALHPRALVLDLHRHGHDVQRIELGYLIGRKLGLPDDELTPLLQQSSIAGLDGTSRSGDRGAALLRGPRALGTLLSQSGYAAVPSATDPAPKPNEEYYYGGFNVYRHGSLAGGSVDAIQVELNDGGAFWEETDRFADAFAAAIVQYLREQYGWTPQ